MVPNIRRRISEHPVATFFVLTYALSWTAWSPLVFAEWWATWSPLLLTGDIRTMLFIMIGVRPARRCSPRHTGRR